MTDLGPSARALLEAARGGGPDAAVIARMRGKIDAAIAAPAAATTVTAATTGTLAGKLGLVALALVVATGVVILATRSRTTTELASYQLTDPSPSPSVHTARELAPPIEDATATIEIETPAPRPRVAPVAPKPPTTISLSREVELVDSAMTALRRGQPREALTFVRQHGKETSQRGQLAEDAMAIEVEALCTLHDPTATSRLAAFDTRWPASAQRARLTTACR